LQLAVLAGDFLLFRAFSAAVALEILRCDVYSLFLCQKTILVQIY
jgi:hypothetical protein